MPTRNRQFTFWLQTLDADVFYSGTKALEPQWNKCVNVDGDCMTVGGVSSAATCHVHIEVRIKFPLPGCVLLSFLKFLVQ